MEGKRVEDIQMSDKHDEEEKEILVNNQLILTLNTLYYGKHVVQPPLRP